MNTRSDAQIDSEVLRTLAHYQQLATSMATPVHVVLLPLPPVVVGSYEELSRSSQESDNSESIDITTLVSRCEELQRQVRSLRMDLDRDKWLKKVIEDHQRLKSELGLDKS